MNIQPESDMFFLDFHACARSHGRRAACRMITAARRIIIENHRSRFVLERLHLSLYTKCRSIESNLIWIFSLDVKLCEQFGMLTQQFILSKSAVAQKPKRQTCDRIGQERVSPLPESIRLIAAGGSKVATRPHLVPERRGYSLIFCVAPRCETHMRFTPYTLSYVFIIMACVNSTQF